MDNINDKKIDIIVESVVSKLLNEGDKKFIPKRFKKNAIKMKGGLRRDFDVDDDRNYNQKVNNSDQINIVKFFDSGYINQSKVAQDLYPDLTEEGAQSEFRKKLKGELSESGYKYHFKVKESRKLKAIAMKILQSAFG